MSLTLNEMKQAHLAQQQEIAELRAEVERLKDVINAYDRDIEKAVAQMVKAGIGEHSPEAGISTLAFQRDELRAKLEIAREALVYYANEDYAHETNSGKARAALAAIGDRT